MTMADRIKERRIALGYTQEELASKLGLQKSAIAKYENGRVENIKRTVILKMSKILECSPSYLLAMDLDNPSPTESVLSDRESAMLNTYRKLEKPRKDAVDQFTDFQYNQQLREARPTLLAAHAHDGADPEAIQADLDIMADDNEWK